MSREKKPAAEKDVNPNLRVSLERRNRIAAMAARESDPKRKAELEGLVAQFDAKLKE